jgi:hypothetical protein
MSGGRSDPTGTPDADSCVVPSVQDRRGRPRVPHSTTAVVRTSSRRGARAGRSAEVRRSATSLATPLPAPGTPSPPGTLLPGRLDHLGIELGQPDPRRTLEFDAAAAEQRVSETATNSSCSAAVNVAFDRPQRSSPGSAAEQCSWTRRSPSPQLTDLRASRSDPNPWAHVRTVFEPVTSRDADEARTRPEASDHNRGLAEMPLRLLTCDKGIAAHSPA